MQVENAVQNRRSIRKFQDKPIPGDVLTRLVELGRLYASGGNFQPVRFAIVSKAPALQQIFRTLRWAMYLPDYEVTETDQPQAYIVLLRDGDVSKKCDFDIGAAATTIMLLAQEQGIDSCCLASFSASEVEKTLGVKDNLFAELVIALGYGAHSSSIAPYTDTQKYHLDSDGNFVVPKRAVEDILVYTDI